MDTKKINDVSKLEDAIEESTNSSLARQNKKHKRNVIIISLIIVIIIAVIGVSVYILNNPRLIFKASVNNMFNIVEENMQDVSDINITTNDNINNLSLNEKNVNSLIKEIKTAFLDAVSSEKISGNKMTIKVNGNDIDTNRVSLVINENNINDVSDKFINNLENNDEFLTAYSSISGSSKNEIIQNLNKATSNYLSSLTISIYTTGITRDFVKLEVSREVNKTTNVINVTKVSASEYSYKIVSQNESLVGTVTHQGDDIVVSYTNYNNDDIVNDGHLTLQRLYE